MVLRKVVFTHLMLLVTPKEKFDPRAYMRWQNHISQQSLRQPKALQQLCLHAMNKSLIQNDSARPVQNINQIKKINSFIVDDDKKNNENRSKIDITDLDVKKTIKKDRSTGKRKSQKDNNIISIQKTTTNRRMTKRKTICSSDTTDESVQISVHSDSDLLDCLSDFELFECDELNKMDSISYEPEIEQIVKDIREIENQIETSKKSDYIEQERKQEINHIKNQTMTLKKYDKVEGNRHDCEKKNNKVTILSSIKFKPENRLFYKIHEPLQLKPIEKDIDLFTNSIPNKKLKQDKVYKTTSKVTKTIIGGNSSLCNEDSECNTYKIGDTVLVRYFKKTWRYYVGVIENINESNQQKPYTISFYKTIHQKSDICFVIPKIEDRDNVPDINIVKEIKLLQIQENPAKYTIMDDDDAVNF
ncbi:unnamed protein product [Euphydryas editha]|uniref:Tudor domain-containing protein n=1 Tax=Euphydryas editha TaxID=104508 RepID=A0AAU9V9V3_EUPED|nr:unnamed protein product [Euphydryas editha]